MGGGKGADANNSQCFREEEQKKTPFVCDSASDKDILPPLPLKI